MIWIRADANEEIGSGHIMRCLSIAAALKEREEEVCFLIADDGAVRLLREKGQVYHILHTPYDRMEEEPEKLRALFAVQQPRLLLLDSYFVTPDYLNRLGKFVKIVYMDDIPRFPYPVNMIINYNIYGDCLPYREQAPKGQKHLLGASYAPLREQFCHVEYTVREEVEQVLLTTGGSDKYHLAGQILEAVLDNKETGGFCYHVVSGAYNPHLSRLEELAAANPNIHIHRNVSDMAALMKACDIAISAGGSTMYELCAVGVPALCFSFVDNQEQIVETFVEKDMVAYGGNYRKEGPAFAGHVADALAALAQDRELRARYSRKARHLVDGNGAARIADALLTL